MVFDRNLIKFDLPKELIASYRYGWQSEVKLMVFNRKSGCIRMHSFQEFPDLIGKEECFANNAKLSHGCNHLNGQENVYAYERGREGGTWVVPSAGLPITAEMVNRLNLKFLTLTSFRGMRPSETRCYEEGISALEYYKIDNPPKTPVFAIGTTVVKALESYAQGGGREGLSELLILPGHEFKLVKGLLTNFHFPCEILSALVAAFVGIEETLEIYRFAVKSRLRFADFGDRLMVN